MKEQRDTPRPTMSDEDMIKDYPRLAREYTLLHQDYREAVRKPLIIADVRGSADADYWSERCKHAENIWKKSPCDPDITDEQIEAHNEYHIFIKDNGSKHYL